MTHTYAMRQLLRLGPLTFAEMRPITGWSLGVLEDCLVRLVRQGYIERFFKPGCGRYVYRLKNEMPDLRKLDRPAHAAGYARAGTAAVRAGARVGVPAAARELRSLQVGAAVRGGQAACVEGAR